MGDAWYLAPLELTRDEFFRSRELIGEGAFARVWESLAGVTIGTELLICGFDDEGGHIATANCHGCSIHDTTGFHAIGAGAWLADGALYAHPRLSFEQLERIIYELCAAKFAAERAPSVGEQTVVLISDASEGAFLADSDLAIVREEWIRRRNKTPLPAAPSSQSLKHYNARQSEGVEQWRPPNGSRWDRLRRHRAPHIEHQQITR